MKAGRYDILVVGAGPAGSCAAMEAGRRNLRVLMIDRKAVIGRPVDPRRYLTGGRTRGKAAHVMAREVRRQMLATQASGA